MHRELKKLVELLKLLLIFSTLTLFFYGFIVWTAEKVEQYQRQEFEEEPKGRALKVFSDLSQETATHLQDMKERLLLFYWLGE